MIHFIVRQRGLDGGRGDNLISEEISFSYLKRFLGDNLHEMSEPICCEK